MSRSSRGFRALALLALLTTPALASIIGPTDGRGPLTERGPWIGLSADEIALIHNATGAIRCSDGAYGTAQLVFNDTTILTAAHNLIDADGFVRGDLAACVFIPQALPGPREPIALAPADNGLFLGTLQRSEGREAFDFAVVRLSRPVPNGRWYDTPAVLPERSAADAQPVVAYQVAAWQPSLGPDDTVPIVQVCRIRDFRPQSLLSDCDVEGAASGGATLVRGSDGTLQLAGIVVTANEAARDGQDYSVPDRIYSFTVAFRELPLEAARAMAAGEALPRRNAWNPTRGRSAPDSTD